MPRSGSTSLLADPCPKCGSDDHFASSEKVEIQGVELHVARKYCNPCGFNEAEVQLTSAPNGYTSKHGDIAVLNMFTQYGQSWTLLGKQKIQGYEMGAITVEPTRGRR